MSISFLLQNNTGVLLNVLRQLMALNKSGMSSMLSVVNHFVLTALYILGVGFSCSFVLKMALKMVDQKLVLVVGSYSAVIVSVNNHTCRLLVDQIRWQNVWFKIHFSRSMLICKKQNLSNCKQPVHRSDFHYLPCPVCVGWHALWPGVSSCWSFPASSSFSLLYTSASLSFTPFFLSCVLIADVPLDLIVLCLWCIWAKGIVSDADS